MYLIEQPNRTVRVYDHLQLQNKFWDSRFFSVWLEANGHLAVFTIRVIHVDIHGNQCFHEPLRSQRIEH